MIAFSGTPIDPGGAGAKVVQQVVQIDQTEGHASGSGIANEVVQPVHVEATVDEFAQLRVGCFGAAEQVGDASRPFLAENVPQVGLTSQDGCADLLVFGIPRWNLAEGFGTAKERLGQYDFVHLLHQMGIGIVPDVV